MKILEGAIRRLRHLAFTPDGQTLVAAGKGTYSRSLELWDWRRPCVRRCPYTSTDDVRALAVSRGGESFAVGDTLGGVRRYAFASGLDVTTFRPGGPDGTVLALDFAPDGAALVSINAADGLIHRGQSRAVLWSLAKGGATAALSAVAELTCARFAPDGRTIALGARRGDVVLWDVGATALDRGSPGDARCPPGVHLLRLSERVPRPAKRHEADVRHVAFTPDGRTLIAVLGTMVAVWDPDRGALLSACAGHPRVIRAAALAPDGRTLAVAAADAVRLIEPTTGAERARYAAGPGKPDCLAFSPDGRALAVGGQKTIVLWDVDEGA